MHLCGTPQQVQSRVDKRTRVVKKVNQITVTDKNHGKVTNTIHVKLKEFACTVELFFLSGQCEAALIIIQ